MSPQLIVVDIAQSIEFYTKNLGFEIDFLYEDFYAGILSNGFSIHLKAGKPVIDERKNKKDKEHLDLIFSVENIEYLYREFSNKSVKMIQALRNMPYGREFYIADPDDYIIAFLEEA